MATNKTLNPTGVTIAIPAMADKPDASVFSNCIDKEADAINALNSNINSILSPDYIEATTLEQFESLLTSVLSTIPAGSIVFKRVRTNFSGKSPTSGSWCIGILYRVEGQIYKISIPDNICYGYYHSGSWHWNYGALQT